MDCPEYLERFSELRDGQAGGDLQKAMEEHLTSCPLCTRYTRTLEEGAALLRSAPELCVPRDFREGLNRRLVDLAAGGGVARESMSSGATTASVLALAALLALAAWAHALHPLPTVELAPLVVAGPRSPSFTLMPRRSTFPGSMSVFSNTGFQEGIWGDANTLLFEYSTLSGRRRDFDLARTGVQ